MNLVSDKRSILPACRLSVVVSSTPYDTGCLNRATGCPGPSQALVQTVQTTTSPHSLKLTKEWKNTYVHVLAMLST